MRVAIVGSGAMGTLLGLGFCKGGHEVTMLDLPERVEQIRSAGELHVVSPEGEESAATPALVTADYAEAGIQDFVILATKSQDLPDVSGHLHLLADEDTAFVTIQNGIPWWYLYGLEPGTDSPRIDCLDPDGRLESNISVSQIIGCVSYPAATLDEQGRAIHVEGLRFPVGELDGKTRERTKRLSRLFEDGGFKSRIIDDIRSEIWLKAWGAVSINPVSALSRATMVDICSFELTRELIAEMMAEVQKLAESLGASFRHTIEKRIEGAKAVGAHKTSMLQDVEAGRPLELDALMQAVIQLADMKHIGVPTVRAVYACTALLNAGIVNGAAAT